jgi:SAM-dependent methyltransferase
MNDADFSPTIERFTGFGADYDRARPSPPAALADLLLPIAGCAPPVFPSLVVDLGSGTGLSTRYWAAHARAVIGVEPAASMREQAEAHGEANGGDVTYRAGFSHATGLPDGCADLVVCSQALHWMEPSTTFAEAARILRAGGVFAACDYDWPPATSSWEVDQAYADCMDGVRRREREHGIAASVPRWNKAGHLERLRESGHFRFVRECLLHHTEEGNAERVVAVLLSQGSVRSLLKLGLSEEDLGIGRLREVASRALGDAPSLWFWSARVRIGVR